MAAKKSAKKAVKKSTAKRQYARATLSVTGIPCMTMTQRAHLAAWLRAQAAAIDSRSADQHARRFTARYY